ncbi:anti-sigma factor [Rhizobium grahamii]|uniref:Anti-sigma factor n=1 Tax=Rhizobium grahamii TaxID=1120045 RepID=A0A5Q0CAL5_9HYPH|nr:MULTISPECIES: anti-sigma factor [Rhizobium]QFY62502.1 anti-sigma factor [Rhizobium grahamii]QRM48574.1 anti-sigma factor [Rhizobium sp. BG6]
MTSSDQSKGGRSRDEVLAGEYVLGVLSFKDRRVVEERMRHDRQFAAIVSRWEANLSTFNDDYDVVNPNPETFKEIEARLFGVSEKPATASGGLWNSVVFWRSLTAASVVVAAASLVLAFAAVYPTKSSAPLVAELTAPGSQMDLLASYEADSGRLRIVPVAAGKPEQKSLELWLVPAEGTPKSLGVFEPGQAGELVIPADMRANIVAGTTLAVSLEPFGGSPSGVATGPVIASGSAHRP